MDSVAILYLERYPVQAQLLVRGSLPTPCHSTAFEVQDLGDFIDVLLWSLADPETECITVLEPFDLAIPLGSFASADLPVRLNGDEVGRIRSASAMARPRSTGRDGRSASVSATATWTWPWTATISC